MFNQSHTLASALAAVTKQRVSRTRWIYVIRIGSLYKIGVACEPWNRVRNMQLPEKPETVFMFQHPDAQAVERLLHFSYKPKREHGEWFALTGEDITAIKAQCAALIGKRINSRPAKVYSMRKKA